MRIGLESLGCGTQELRDCRQIPITFLGVDVPEVHRQVGEQGLHVEPLLIPPLHTGHRERMPKRHQAGPTPALGGLDG